MITAQSQPPTWTSPISAWVTLGMMERPAMGADQASSLHWLSDAELAALCDDLDDSFGDTLAAA